MMFFKQTALKPQDVVVCLKIALERGSPSIQFLSQTLRISAGEVHGAIGRAKQSRLINVDGKANAVMRTALLEFVVHGLKYAFPAITGANVIGTTTGVAAIAEFNRHFAPTEALPHVWPKLGGKTNGIALAPLFPSVTEAINFDARLYKSLALIDAIRAGAAREREFAVQEIRTMIAA